MKTPLHPFFFHAIGLFSTVSLLLLVSLFAIGHFEGTRPLQRFIEANPGSEAFLIFILPVILTASPVWIAGLLRRFSSKKDF